MRRVSDSRRLLQYLVGGIITQDTNLQKPGTPYFSDEYILYQGGVSQNAIFFEFTQGGA